MCLALAGSVIAIAQPTQPVHPTKAQIQAAGEAFRAGSAAFERNDLAAAHAEFAKAVRLAPQVAAAHAAFGTVLLAEGNLKAATAELETAHRLDPGDAHTALNLAVATARTRDYNRSVALFAGVAALPHAEPFSAEEALAYATALSALGRNEAALATLGDALGRVSNDAGLLDAYGSLLAQMKRTEEAVAQFKQALAAEPNLATAHYHLGSVYLNEHNPAAVGELERAATLDKTNAAYALQLGRALNESGQLPAAIDALRRAAALDPQSIDAQYQLALALQSAGQAKEAVPLFTTVAVARPDDPAVLTNQALALVQTGQAKAAIPIYLKAIALQPQSALPHENLGAAYLQLNELDQAIEQFRAGLALEPSSPQLHYNLGLALKLKDDMTGAIPEFEQAAALDPQLPDPPFTLGVLFMQLGQFDKSRVELEKATALRPDNGAAWEMLGNVYKQGQPPETDKAVAALRRAIDLLPEQPSPHISLAAILAEQHNTSAAAAERKIAADLSRTAVSRQRMAFALQSGQAFLEKGMIPQAIAQFQTAVNAQPNAPEAHVALAEALARNGQAAEAAIERATADRLGKTSAP